MFINVELNRQLKRIEDLIVESELRFEPDDELRSHMAKYLCVMCSGFLENAMYLTFNDIVTNEVKSTVVLSYAKSQLIRIQNPNCVKIKAIVKCFSNDWHKSLESFLKDNERSAAIDYVIKDRHNIAHGKDSDITLSKLKTCLSKIVEVFEFIEQRLLNDVAEAVSLEKASRG